MSLSNPPKSSDQVNLCKGCNTMKHLDANGLCGRCQPDPKRTLDKENSYMGDIAPDQVGALDAILEDWFMKPKADLKAKLSALLVEAKVSENEFWADIAIDSKPTQYDFQDRIKELEMQREET